MLLKTLILSSVLALASAGTNASEQHFEEWCDAFTAQGMVSLAANRIFGHVSSLTDVEYEARSEWVNNAYNLAGQRFKKRTGEDFMGYEFEPGREDWVSRCQLADQIQ